MARKSPKTAPKPGHKWPFASNVKRKRKRCPYDRFGEVIRYLTLDELQQFYDAITNYRHKLMMQLVYELGCRVGEFVRIQLKHISFSRSNIFFPAENTKGGFRRTSHVPKGLMNEVLWMLRQQGRVAKSSERVLKPDEYLFHPGRSGKRLYSENRLRQIFKRYVKAAGLGRIYGKDKQGRALHELTIHSLRHSHIMHCVHDYKIPVPVVQRQVGHKNLKTTSVYLKPSAEQVGQVYEEARRHHLGETTGRKT